MAGLKEKVKELEEQLQEREVRIASLEFLLLPTKIVSVCKSNISKRFYRKLCHVYEGLPVSNDSPLNEIWPDFW